MNMRKHGMQLSAEFEVAFFLPAKRLYDRHAKQGGGRSLDTAESVSQR